MNLKRISKYNYKKKGLCKMENQYIVKKEALNMEIVELIEKCNDISLLDLIQKLLKKSI